MRVCGGASGDPGGVLIADDTQAIKKGDRSVGVARQYCGLTGQGENCQVMPMLTYASEAGHAFINRRLYMPEGWLVMGDGAGRRECGAGGFRDQASAGGRHAHRGAAGGHVVSLPGCKLRLWPGSGPACLLPHQQDRLCDGRPG
ncbi:transposase [Streptosporangium sp. NBC_01639]|uniref:transposase n=1 Tax=Streptosporangium sp. NBC_01639 TaxID=2975948 RepID=UPI00386CEDA4